MSIIDREVRVGNFTSSQIFKLMNYGERLMTESELAERPKKGTGSKTTKTTDFDSFGDVAQTYIEEKIFERRIGRPISIERTGKPALWGHYNESRVHGLLGLGYQLIEDKTIFHPEIKYWCGTPDLYHERESVDSDIKCYEPKKFCKYVNALREAKKTGSIEKLKQDFAQEFWQLISNSVLLNTKHIEAVVYMPYFKELEEIRLSVDDLESDEDIRKYSFIKYSGYNELPYLQDDRYYKNLNVFRFEASQEDKYLLTKRVIEAGKKLIPNPYK